MHGIRLYSEKDILPYLSVRSGETKLGERILFPGTEEALKEHDSPFVVLGIPEDIGVRANCGRPGSSTAWAAFLSSFLNVQENRYLSGRKIQILGEIDTTEEMQKASNIDVSDPNYYEKLGDLVEKIDNKVSDAVSSIVQAGKFPVLIGGGHNNAYGNLKGSSDALGTPINVLNIDAHTDLRKLEHRHSGNGFSYAKQAGALEKYAVFGLHRNYTPEYIFQQMDRSQDLHYSLWDDLLPADQKNEFLNCIKFVNNKAFGLEVDCDAIADFPSSALSPVGISLSEVRKFIARAAKEKNCCYLHICEAAPGSEYPTGKALTYLVTDFLRSRMND